jgi:hypothetical protein
MGMNVPAELVDAIREGRAVLFLGAGASRGAMDEKGAEIPTGILLAEMIVNWFLGKEYLGSDFRTAYDLAGSARDILTVQKFIFEVLSPFQPADFHLISRPRFARYAGRTGCAQEVLQRFRFGMVRHSAGT